MWGSQLYSQFNLEIVWRWAVYFKYALKAVLKPSIARVFKEGRKWALLADVFINCAVMMQSMVSSPKIPHIVTFGSERGVLGGRDLPQGLTVSSLVGNIVYSQCQCSRPAARFSILNIEYCEVQGPGPTLSRGVGAPRPLTAQCSVRTSTTCTVAQHPDEITGYPSGT